MKFVRSSRDLYYVHFYPNGLDLLVKFVRSSKDSYYVHFYPNGLNLLMKLYFQCDMKLRTTMYGILKQTLGFAPYEIQ